MIIRIVLEGYIEISLCCLVNLYSLNWANVFQSFSSLFALLVILTILTFPFAVTVVLIKKSDKYSSLYEGIRTESKLALLYNIFFVLRRLLFAVAATVV